MDPAKKLLGFSYVNGEIAATGQVSDYVRDILEVPPGMVLVVISADKRETVTGPDE